MTIDPIQFAQTLIRHPSITPEEAGVMDTLQAALEGLGFTVWRETFHEEGTPSVENLYARLGEGAPNFCYAGHLDVVPVGDYADWSVDPFAAEIREGSLIGRGAEDMKGAIACFVAAISRFVGENGLFPAAEAANGGRTKWCSQWTFRGVFNVGGENRRLRRHARFPRR